MRVVSDSDERATLRRATLGAALRTRREELGLTRATVAVRTGLSLDTIASVELGRRLPSLEALARLATALERGHACDLLRGVQPWDS